ncbi:MAG: ABC transporter permease, partial [Candidatus Dormibacteraeota bacterium]|nr:ABC transporter permease [Candidatus Dormibacteraeota bacterium]
MAAAVMVERKAPADYLTVFAAILNRDITVTLREFPAFLAQVILQPLFMLFVFGRVLADLGFT